MSPTSDGNSVAQQLLPAVWSDFSGKMKKLRTIFQVALR